MKWPICGPKLSLCCSVISVWGIIQFILMGIFFFVQAAPLIDDFKIEFENETDMDIFNADIKKAFQLRAINCWIAAFLYVGLLTFAGIQFRQHLEKSSTSKIPSSTVSPFSGVTTEDNSYNPENGIQFTERTHT